MKKYYCSQPRRRERKNTRLVSWLSWLAKCSCWKWRTGRGTRVLGLRVWFIRTGWEIEQLFLQYCQQDAGTNTSLVKVRYMWYAVSSMDGMKRLAVCISSWSASLKRGAGQRDNVQISVEVGSMSFWRESIWTEWKYRPGYDLYCGLWSCVSSWYP